MSFEPACRKAAKACQRLVPELARLTGAPAPSAGEPGSDRYLLQSAAAEFLSRLRSLQPLLLVADDLHWADGETLHLLRRLARRAPEARLLALALFRDPGEEIGHTLAETLVDLSRLDGVGRLALDALDAERAGAFMRNENAHTKFQRTPAGHIATDPGVDNGRAARSPGAAGLPRHRAAPLDPAPPAAPWQQRDDGPRERLRKLSAEPHSVCSHHSHHRRSTIGVL